MAYGRAYANFTSALRVSRQFGYGVVTLRDGACGLFLAGRAEGIGFGLLIPLAPEVECLLPPVAGGAPMSEAI